MSNISTTGKPLKPEVVQWLEDVYRQTLNIAENRDDFDLGDLDFDALAKHTENLYERGYSVKHAIQYLSFTEEINASLDEDAALRCMKNISDQYTRSDARQLY